MTSSSAPSQKSDAELVEACARRDARAWRELVGRYRRLVYGIPLSLGLQPADADEVFQQTFAELVRSLPRLRDGSRIEAWLVTTSRRAALRLKRDQRRRVRLHQDGFIEAFPTAHAPSPDQAIDALRDAERVLRAIEALGEPCRTLLVGLFSSPPRPYKELARSLGLAIGSLGATRGRCLRRLRLRLQRGRADLHVADGASREEAP